jgi:prevent-host-death family protein
MVAEKTIPQRELRNNVADVLRRVEGGESFVITVSGRPVAEIRPLPRPRRTGNRELLEKIRALTALDPDWQRDIDNAIDQEIRIR